MNLQIKPSKNTPEISFNESGKLLMEGRSYPEESVSFFQPLFKWVENFSSEEIVFDIKLEYFNTSTCKQILSLLRLLIDNNPKSNIEINWHYEKNDMDLYEIGQHIENILKFKLNFIRFVAVEKKPFLGLF